MWAPVISVVWTIMYMMQRKIMPGNLGQETPTKLKEQWQCCLSCDRTEARKKTPNEAHRALELLEDYHAKLTRPQDKQLRLAIERVIRIFKSRLFQALLDREMSRSCGKSKGIALKLFLFMEKRE
ncbi:hypothetical protein PUN28_000092 [Cardiocondyla obscurior]|uniref:L27 domain-containing protein n=1 Tax=Cardiocondyla obscurior TaxID=286306 RepID=A0AAW2GY30_9HYME